MNRTDVEYAAQELVGACPQFGEYGYFATNNVPNVLFSECNKIVSTPKVVDGRACVLVPHQRTDQFITFVTEIEKDVTQVGFVERTNGICGNCPANHWTCQPEVSEGPLTGLMQLNVAGNTDSITTSILNPIETLEERNLVKLGESWCMEFFEGAELNAKLVQNRAMMDVLKEGLRTEFLPPQLVQAIYLHDIARSMDDETKKKECFKKLSRLEIFEYPMRLTALGFAYGSTKVEALAKSMRGEYGKATTRNISSSIKRYAKTLDKNPNNARAEINSAFTKQATEFNNDIRKFRSPIAAVETLREASDMDIEAVIIKVAETIIHMRRVEDDDDDKTKLSKWRNAQELISFHVPMCRLFGFSNLAEIANMEARAFLNEGEYHPEDVKQYHEAAGRVQERISDDLEYISIGYWGATKDQVKSRLKTLPSMIEKFAGKYKGELALSDALGFTIIVDYGKIGKIIDAINKNSLQESELIEYVKLLKDLLGLNVGHTREGEEDIEINLNGVKPKKAPDGELIPITYTLDDGTVITVKSDVARPSGYEAIHISFNTPEGDMKVGIEVKIMTEDAYEKQSTGRASHLFYLSEGKTRNGVSSKTDVRMMRVINNRKIEFHGRQVAHRLSPKSFNAFSNLLKTNRSSLSDVENIIDSLKNYGQYGSAEP